jgi:hypothetical protein
MHWSIVLKSGNRFSAKDDATKKYRIVLKSGNRFSAKDDATKNIASRQVLGICSIP